jgi:hypothetical protein
MKLDMKKGTEFESLLVQNEKSMLLQGPYSELKHHHMFQAIQQSFSNQGLYYDEIPIQMVYSMHTDSLSTAHKVLYM